MGIKYNCIVVFFLNWACTSLSQGWLPVENRGGRAYFVIELQEGMSVLSLVNSSAIPLDTFLKDNPKLGSQSALGTKIFIRAKRGDLAYKVLPGDTPFRIAKQFDIALDSLYSSNPRIQNTALKVGQSLQIRKGLIRLGRDAFETPKSFTEEKVPANKDINERSFEFEDSILFYKVRSGENLSELAKRFFIKISELKTLNALKSNTLQAGTTLKIPINKEVFLPVQHDVQAIQLANPMHTVNEANELSSSPAFQKLEYFKIGVFLPFGFDTLRFPLKGLSKMAMEFYMGAKMAVDSLEGLGCKGEVRYFDYCSGRDKIEDLISSGTLDDYNVLIGPMHNEDAILLTQYCEEKNIAMVYQGMNLPKIKSLKSNIYYVHTEMTLQLEKLSSLALEAARTNQVVFYRTNLPSDTARERYFLERYNQLSFNNHDRIISADLTTLKGLLGSGNQNVVISVSLDKQKVLELNSLALKNKTSVKLLGLKEWTDWKEINATINNESDFFYFSTSCLDYSNPSVKKFHKVFRAIYNSDLTKFSLFGFDVILGFAGSVSTCSSSLPYKGLFVKFDYPENKNTPTSFNNGLVLCRFKNFKQIKDAKFE